MGLLNSTVLDWAIGIIFVYLLLAVVCTTINEWIAGITSVRAKTLEKGIAQLLDKQPTSDTSKTFLDEFYDHPLVAGMFTPGKSGAAGHPSYLPSRTFATALMDLATKGIQGTITFDQLQNGAKALPPGNVQRALLALIQNSSGDLTRAQKNIEQWYDDSMQRVSGWYKRRTQYVTIAIAVVLTLATNADTIKFGHMLWINPTLRSAMVEQAKNRTDTGKEAARSEVVEYAKGSLTPIHKEVDKISDQMKPLKPLLGWSVEDWNDLQHLSTLYPHLLGWIISIVAISLGSPFWFDLLNKLMNIRNAGKKPETSDNQTDGGNMPTAGTVAVAVEKVGDAK